jgi:hypothetical protein
LGGEAAGLAWDASNHLDPDRPLADAAIIVQACQIYRPLSILP